MVITGYYMYIVFEFRFRDMFVYKIGIRIISKINSGFMDYSDPPPLTGPPS